MATKDGFAPSPLAIRDCFLIYGDRCLVGNEAFQVESHRIPSSQDLCQTITCDNIPTNNLYSTATWDEFNGEQVARPYLHTANILRYGTDVFISGGYETTGNKAGMQYAIDWFKIHHPSTTVHLVENAIDHLDGYIHFIRPGLALSSLPKSLLPDFFKSWDIIECTRLNKHKIYGSTYAHKYRKLNPIVARQYTTFMQANPEETFFILNGLTLNENTVILPGVDITVFNHLEKRGVEPISVDFRATTFFDCGIHCATNELAREGACETYR